MYFDCNSPMFLDKIASGRPADRRDKMVLDHVLFHGWHSYVPNLHGTNHRRSIILDCFYMTCGSSGTPVFAKQVAREESPTSHDTRRLGGIVCKGIAFRIVVAWSPKSSFVILGGRMERQVLNRSVISRRPDDKVLYAIQCAFTRRRYPCGTKIVPHNALLSWT